MYGNNQSVPFKETDAVDHPISIYAATKKSDELMANAYAHLYGIQTIGLRFFTVYGPFGRPDMAPMLFANAIQHDEVIRIFNNGNLSRDFTHDIQYRTRYPHPAHGFRPVARKELGERSS